MLVKTKIITASRTICIIVKKVKTIVSQSDTDQLNFENEEDFQNDEAQMNDPFLEFEDEIDFMIDDIAV